MGIWFGIAWTGNFIEYNESNLAFGVIVVCINVSLPSGDGLRYPG
jgi:hypothetical protein